MSLCGFLQKDYVNLEQLYPLQIFVRRKSEAFSSKSAPDPIRHVYISPRRRNDETGLTIPTSADPFVDRHHAPSRGSAALTVQCMLDRHCRVLAHQVQEQGSPSLAEALRRGRLVMQSFCEVRSTREAFLRDTLRGLARMLRCGILAPDPDVDQGEGPVPNLSDLHLRIPNPETAPVSEAYLEAILERLDTLTGIGTNETRVEGACEIEALLAAIESTHTFSYPTPIPQPDGS